MADRKRPSKKRISEKQSDASLKDILSLYSKIADIKNDVKQVADSGNQADERLTDIEIHINLLTRLLTTLCIEKFGIQVGVLKRLVRRIEKEAIRDSQILELESIYNLSHQGQKKAPPPQIKSKEDPWDKIS